MIRHDVASMLSTNDNKLYLLLFFGWEFLSFFLFLHLLSAFDSANLCVRVELVAVGKGSGLG